MNNEPVICLYATFLPSITYCLFLFIYVNCACTFYVNMLWQRCIVCSHANKAFFEFEFERERERAQRGERREREEREKERERERERESQSPWYFLRAPSVEPKRNPVLP